ncbi:MAG: BREX system P-loop protein BrxC [Acidobacteria bacterium]|nr:BREX system P-loop protein BrxC [Acidobacteriota bacterium]
MKIHEALDRDPRTERLANNGQARIADVDDGAAREELRAELETFVCDGQFGDALQRILDRYLANLGTPKQDSAWVSGFFGSGKSHLLKMLTHLWTNTEFPDGATARGLVRGGLPDEVQAQLRELDTHAHRAGRSPVAAAGTLLGGSVDHVRHTVLSILLRARGLPAQYPQARFCFWLRERGLLAGVRAVVEQAGKDWIRELNSLYVSPLIAGALIAADASFATDVKAARQLLTRQFPPPRTDISTEEFIEAARLALSADAVNGELPHTILVLDEVQQYINEAQDRSAALTEVAEAVQTQFDSRVMLVGAGQSALSAGAPALMWLRDRFRIAVELTDADVEAVTRKVLLHKRPSAGPEIEQMFETHAGEVARHLQGTRIGTRPEDASIRAADYPLLCTRRRFWEACFQAADAAGSQSQLRSQLRILHDSLARVADRPLGATIPASDLFDALAPSLVNTGVLPNEINTRIQKLNGGSEEGRLQRDLCGLVFLIGKLPRQEGTDLGVRANAATLADLLLDDVTTDSGPLRHRIAGMLASLAKSGVLMQVAEEYRLQTTEGAEWERAFRERRQALTEVEITSRRDQLFGQAVQDVLGGMKPLQGQARLRRKLAMHTGGEPPPPNGEVVSVWLRDGWSCGRKEVDNEARRLGAGDATLHVHLPKKSADLLRGHVLDAEAARQVLDHYGVPASPEGREARASMESRLSGAAQDRDAIVRDVVRAATVLQGGGTEVFGDGLGEKLRTGAGASLARLFPRFDDGDHRGWEVAVTRARQGSDQPLKVVGWDGPTDAHPVAREVLGTIGAGARGTAVHRVLKTAPYGWPQDAIDAVLITLHRAGHLRATRNGQPVAAGALDQAGIKAAEFRPEKVRLTTSQRIALRGLFNRLGVNAKSGEEENRAPEFLGQLEALAGRAGGAAPLPPAPDAAAIDDLKRLAGSEQLAEIHGRKDELEQSIADWATLAERAAARKPDWDLALAFRRHAGGLPAAASAGADMDSVVAQRSLLAETDHVRPIVATLAAALRAALVESHRELTGATEAARATLAGDATWARLDATAQDEIRGRLGLDAPPPLAVATDKNLLHALEARSLAAWRSEIDAVEVRIGQALLGAAAQIDADAAPGGGGTTDGASPPQTTTIHVRRGTLQDEAAVREWLREQEDKLTEAVQKGPVIVR